MMEYLSNWNIRHFLVFTFCPPVQIMQYKNNYYDVKLQTVTLTRTVKFFGNNCTILWSLVLWRMCWSTETNMQKVMTALFSWVSWVVDSQLISYFIVPPGQILCVSSVPEICWLGLHHHVHYSLFHPKCGLHWPECMVE